MKLTGTNCSIGFIALILDVRKDASVREKDQNACFDCSLPAWWLGEEKKPVPIPNTAVKLLCADGTLSQGTGE